MLGLEQGEEVAQDLDRLSSFSPKELEADGLALTRMVIDETSTGLYGRSLVTFVNSKRQPLPPHQFTPRDVAKLRLANLPTPKTNVSSAELSKQYITGVVYSVKPESICIAFDEEPTENLSDGSAYHIFKTSNDVVFTTYSTGLDRLKTAFDDPDAPARDVLSMCISSIAVV